MSKTDWFRRRRWTAKDKEEFFSRLGRTRTDYSKAQYLRIQAYTLQTEATPPDYLAALDLLDYIFREVPEPDQMPSAYLQRATCLEALGRNEEATQAFREAILRGINKNGVQTTDAPVHFARFVLRNNLKGMYDEALAGLKGCDLVGILPNSQYLLNAVMAIIGSETGRAKEAKKYALKALEIAKHADLQDGDDFIYNKIVQLVSG